MSIFLAKALANSVIQLGISFKLYWTMVVIGAAVYIINVVVCDKEISRALHKIFLTRSLLITKSNWSSKLFFQTRLYLYSPVSVESPIIITGATEVFESLFRSYGILATQVCGCVTSSHFGVVIASESPYAFPHGFLFKKLSW